MKDELEEKVAEIFKAAWDVRDGQVVPQDSDVGLGNDAVKLDATVLYADLADSTNLVDGWKAPFAAEIYKTFLHCAARIIRHQDGVITAYDGDRVTAVFIGRDKNRNAARAALMLNTACHQIIAPAMQIQYASNTYRLKHVVGIDCSELFIARTGIRGANDLVWVGRAANHAAKMAALPEDHQIYISKDVHADLDHKLLYNQDTGTLAWEAATWKDMNDKIIYRSTSIWVPLA